MFKEVYQLIILVRYLYYFDNNIFPSLVGLSFKLCRDNFYSMVILGNRVFIRK